MRLLYSLHKVLAVPYSHPNKNRAARWNTGSFRLNNERMPKCHRSCPPRSWSPSWFQARTILCGLKVFEQSGDHHRHSGPSTTRPCKVGLCRRHPITFAEAAFGPSMGVPSRCAPWDLMKAVSLTMRPDKNLGRQHRKPSMGREIRAEINMYSQVYLTPAPGPALGCQDFSFASLVRASPSKSAQRLSKDDDCTAGHVPRFNVHTVMCAGVHVETSVPVRGSGLEDA